MDDFETKFQEVNDTTYLSYFEALYGSTEQTMRKVIKEAINEKSTNISK